MPLAKLDIELEARLARLEEGLEQSVRINAKAAKDVEQRWAAAGSTLKSVLAPLAAAFSVAAIQNFVSQNAKAVDSLNDIADATGSTVENISALQDIATRTGTSIETVDTALIKLNQALNAAKPDSDQARALKQIGLSADELRKLDPAEALRRVAVALEGIADDGKGGKARVVMELLGKSTREVAPLLKDLAQQTQLVGSISAEQAAKAEKFAHAVGQFETNATRARQALLLELLPALTEVTKAFNEGGLLKALDAFGNRVFDWENSQTRKQIKTLQRDLADLQKQSEALGDVGSQKLGITAQLQAKSAQLDALVNQLIQNQSPPPREAVGNLEGLRGKLGAPGATAAERAKAAAEAAFLAKQFAEDQEEQAKIASEAWGAVAKERNKDLEATNEAERLRMKAWFEMIDREQEDAIKAGQPFLEQKLQEVSEFTKQAARNVQDALGGSLKKALKGDFDGILDLWKDTLFEMAAQAAAARLNEFLFGKDFGGGLIGPLIGGFLGSKAVGSESVPRDGLAFVHRGERILTAQQNARGGWGGGISLSITNQINGSNLSEAQLVRAMNTASDNAVARVFDMQQRGLASA